MSIVRLLGHVALWVANVVQMEIAVQLVNGVVRLDTAAITTKTLVNLFIVAIKAKNAVVMEDVVLLACTARWDRMA